MNGGRVFVDTGAWLALAMPDDTHHTRASRMLKELLASSIRLVTTNHVLGETYTYLSRACSPAIALGFIERAGTSLALDLIHVTADREQASFALLRRYADHCFSFVDATSFVIMKDLGLGRAFTFDRHFETAGFTMVPNG